MTDLIGQSLGPYQILGEIGRGGMAVVYEAYHPVLARRVAIKVLLPHLATDAALVRRFLQEARSAASLTHPNIVTIYDVVEQRGQYYIVMQRLPGQPLNQLIRPAGVLPLPRAAAITSQIAAALDYAHRNKIVHRDVKPANIIVGPDDHAVLTDFGVARAAEAFSLTSFGVVIGTPEYMSPEQAKGETAGPASDLYSLGIVLYEMLSGRVPFRAPNTPALLFKQVYETPPPVRTHVPELAEGVDGVLARALAKQPQARFATGGELAQTLQALSPVAGAVSTPPRLPKPAEPPAAAKTRLLRPPAPAGGEARPAQAHPAASPWNLPGWLLPLMGVIIVALLGAVVALWPRPSAESPAPPSPQPIGVVAVSPTPAMTLLAPATSTLNAPEAEAHPTATAVVTPTPVVAVATAAIAAAPTSTPAPTLPLPSATPTAPPALTVAQPTATRSAETQVPQQRQAAAPRLGLPNGSTESGVVRFAWTAAETLGPSDGYALLVWPDNGRYQGKSGLDLPAVHDACGQPLRDTQFVVNNVAQLAGGGAAGRYLWTVVIVDTSRPDGKGHACTVISGQPTPLAFEYSSGGGQCQPPAGGCPPRTSWDQASCSCK